MAKRKVNWSIVAWQERGDEIQKYPPTEAEAARATMVVIFLETEGDDKGLHDKYFTVRSANGFKYFRGMSPFERIAFAVEDLSESYEVELVNSAP